jgi:hypothetical protein
VITSIENCYRHDIDYSCTYKGGYTLNMIDAAELIFRRNTIHTTGPSALFKAEVRNLIELNDLSRNGYCQNDGSMIQVSVKQQGGNVTRYNWLGPRLGETGLSLRQLEQAYFALGRERPGASQCR